MNTPVQLTASGGVLYRPRTKNDFRFDESSNEPMIVIRIYNTGDCDAIHWPFGCHGFSYTKDKDRCNLGVALYDAREMGLIPNGAKVLLPNGEEFDFDHWCVQDDVLFPRVGDI